MAYDYTKYNYDELVTHTTELLQEKGEWKDAYQSSTGITLVQLIASMTEQLHYMLERRTQESYLPTAKLKSSVGAIANQLGYRPRRAVSARSTISMKIVDNNGITVRPSGEIIIPKYSPLSYEDKVFVNASEININPLDTPPYEFSIIEGVVDQKVFDPTDIDSTLFQKNYILIKDYDFIENESLYIHTDSQEFFDVKRENAGEPALESLAFAGPQDNAYDIRVTNEGLQILFGDGVNGSKPRGNLYVDWVRSSASRVHIPSTGLNFLFDTPKVSDVNDTSYNYVLTNIEAVDGGLEPETIEVTKRNAPDYIRTNARAVTKNDYDYWARRAGIGGIIDTSVYGEEEIGISVINANNVFVTYLTQDGSKLSPAEELKLREYLDTYKTITTHLIIQEAELVPLQITARVKRSKFVSASNSELYDLVKERLVELFALTEGSLKEHVYHSDLVNYITGIELAREGVGRKIAEFVTIDAKALKEVNAPWKRTNNSVVEVTYGFDGDRYAVKLDDFTFYTDTTSGDNGNTVAARLAPKINLHPNLVASNSGSDLTITLDPEARNNQVLWSEDFTRDVWVKENLTIAPMAGDAPNGVPVASRLEETADVGSFRMYQSMQPGTNTAVFRVKQGERRYVRMHAQNPVDGVRSVTDFDIQNGVILAGPGAIVDLGDGWMEITITATSFETDYFYLFLHDGNDIVYQGVGGNGVYVWGAQFEVGGDFGGYLKTEDVPVYRGAAITPYKISFEGSTNQTNLNTAINLTLPVSTFKNEEEDRLFVPGSIELIDTDGSTLDVDDGAGSFYGGTVDYVTGTITMDLPPLGDYYIRYSQNVDDNFLANNKQAFTYSMPKNDYSGTTEKLSTIEII